MKVQRFEFNMFGENTYVVWDEVTHEAAVIDPGMVNAGETKQFDMFIANNNLKLKYLLYTHLHVDHTFGHEHIAGMYKLEATAHADETPLGIQRQSQARMFGLPSERLQSLPIGHRIADGELLKLGDETIKALLVPGHSPGSIAYYCPSDKMVFTGDALFHGSIGRTDLPGGNHQQLIHSIINKLLTLPDDTVVYPGHGPSTTIGYEKQMNPYL